MNHEQKFIQLLKNTTYFDVVDWSVEHRETLLAELGEEESNRLSELCQQYGKLIDVEIATINLQYSKNEMKLSQLQAFHSFIKKPYHGLIPLEWVEEMEWRWQCLIHRAVPGAYQR